MAIKTELNELFEKGVITAETLDKITAYYQNKKQHSPQRLLLVFGILGAILIGLGIILILAHNWEQLSKSSKTLIAFTPLLVGYFLLAFVLLKKQDSRAWRESVSAFLFFALGSCLALISQIYNIPGDLASFMLTWMILCIPLLYVAHASIVSCLYIVGITYYANLTGYWRFETTEQYWYWLLLGGVIPHYYFQIKNKPYSNFTNFQHWLIALSLTMVLGTLAKNHGSVMYIAYFSLFGLFFMLGKTPHFNQNSLSRNAYLIIGSAGSIILLLLLSFNDFWINLSKQTFVFQEVIYSPELISAMILSLAACSFLIYIYQKYQPDLKNPMYTLFIIFILLYLVGIYFQISVIIINLVVFVLGLWYVYNGHKKERLGMLNYGLFIITALVACRFFDTDLSFVMRGILFVLVGIGFIVANYKLIQKKERK